MCLFSKGGAPSWGVGGWGLLAGEGGETVRGKQKKKAGTG